MNARRSLWALGILLVLAPEVARAQKTIILVRHAEKLDAPAGDPSLSPQGKVRALALRDLLKDAEVAAIFTSPFRRTKETAQPLASARGLTAREDPMADPATLVKAIHDLPEKGSVLVVGHTNTIPKLLKALGVEAPPAIGEEEFDNLFVVTTEGAVPPRVLRLRYKR